MGTSPSRPSPSTPSSHRWFHGPRFTRQGQSGERGEFFELVAHARGTFPAYENETPWDAVQVAYFTSAATWNYLTAPFVFAHPKVTTQEIAPWTEDGQTWRRLAVTFPGPRSAPGAGRLRLIRVFQ